VVLDMFKSGNFVIICIVAAMYGYTMYGIMYYLPLYFQIVRGYSATLAGLHMIALMISISTTNAWTGIFISKTGLIRTIAVSGCFIQALGMGILYLLRPDSSLGYQIGLPILAGFGTGCLIQGVIVIAQNSVPQQNIASATSFVLFLRSIGAVFGLTAFNVIVRQQFYSALPPDLKYLGGSQNFDPTSLSTLPAQEAATALSAYCHALDIAYVACAPLSAVALIASLFLKQITFASALSSPAKARNGAATET